MGSQPRNYYDHLSRCHRAYRAIRCKCVVPSSRLPDEQEASRHAEKLICAKICKSFRTESLNAGLTLSGLLPLDLRGKVSAGSKYISSEEKKPTVSIDSKTAPRRDQKGEGDPPVPVSIRRLRDHYANAFSEFIALTSTTLKVHKPRASGY
ncbi:hypothetical protein EVAR_25324_1 [Eumeta japonica]|uniref:Uncharacterized protein n=1 Tax=Eumeta variegata TaxID=151549 RepID=A0A4C1VP81_EUMVA|nr:hypothetical protein EVAR_25324_1 [Eumeta japonica]